MSRTLVTVRTYTCGDLVSLKPLLLHPHIASIYGLEESDGGWCPRWSPEGKRLWFVSDEGIHSVPVRVEGGSAIIGAPELVFASPWLSVTGSYAVAADGRLLVVRPADWVLEPDELRVVVGA